MFLLIKLERRYEVCLTRSTQSETITVRHLRIEASFTCSTAHTLDKRCRNHRLHAQSKRFFIKLDRAAETNQNNDYAGGTHCHNNTLTISMNEIVLTLVQSLTSPVICNGFPLYHTPLRMLSTVSRHVVTSPNARVAEHANVANCAAKETRLAFCLTLRRGVASMTRTVSPCLRGDCC